MPRISQLPSLTTADNSDEIAIVDVSASVTKKITRGELLKAPLPNNAVTTASITNGSVTADKIDFTTFVPFKSGSTGQLSATGAKTITGIGFKPRAIRFYLDTGPAGLATTAIGSFDGSSHQSSSSATGASARSSSSSNTSIRLRSESGADLSVFTVTSLNSDGFTINVSVSNFGGASWFYECIR